MPGLIPTALKGSKILSSTIHVKKLIQKQKRTSQIFILNLKARTVTKLRSINLLFSSMFCIESKIVHVGAEKIITLYK